MAKFSIFVTYEGDHGHDPASNDVKAWTGTVVEGDGNDIEVIDDLLATIADGLTAAGFRPGDGHVTLDTVQADLDRLNALG